MFMQYKKIAEHMRTKHSRENNPLPKTSEDPTTEGKDEVWLLKKVRTTCVNSLLEMYR